MRFLLKAAFWLTIVILLLPSSKAEKPAPAPKAAAPQVVSPAATAAVDRGDFCTREPAVCAAGAQAAAAISQMAKAAAKVVHGFLRDQLDPSATGSVPARGAAQPAAASGKVSHGTLTPADLAPAWRRPGRSNGA